MSLLVEALHRLFVAGKVSVEKMDSLLSDAKITYEEYDYIIS